MIKKEAVLKSLNWRYATQVYDQKKKLSEEDLKFILEAGRLSPSSFGFEPWKFLVIKNKDLRKKMRENGYDQPKFTESSHLVVIAKRTDVENFSNDLLARTAKIQKRKIEELSGFKAMIEGAISGHQKAGDIHYWINSQCYIALGFILSASAMIGVDAGPMEGFDYDAINKVLGLTEKNLSVSAIVALGYRGVDPRASWPKVRRGFKDVVEVVR